MRIREGVSPKVNARMEAVQANTLREDGLMFRTCEHGVRHPVGHMNRPLRKEDFAVHEMKTDSSLPRRVPCCDAQCCHEWPTTPQVIVESLQLAQATNAVDPSAQPSGTPSARVSSSESED